MDDWLTNTAGGGPVDGAFERFLTAALAAIITLVFSWRLLGEVSETEREEALRRHIRARASGQTNVPSLGISDDKLREVAIAFAEDRTKRLQSQTQTTCETSDGSSVDHSTESTPEKHVRQKPDVNVSSEFSTELTGEDRQFIESLLKSEIESDNIPIDNDTLLCSTGIPGEQPSLYHTENEQLEVIEECNLSPQGIQDNNKNSDLTFRLDDFPVDDSTPAVDSQDLQHSDLTQLASYLISATSNGENADTTTTSPDDSDEEEFQQYFHDASGPRVFDSDDETFYRTFLEPIQEELSGEEKGSSSDEWGDPGEDNSSDDSGSSTPRPQESDQLQNGLDTFSEDISQDINSSVQTDLHIPSKTCEVVKLNEPILSCEIETAQDSSVRETLDSQSKLPSPEHRISVICEPDESDFLDDNVSETSDDTVIMVFSNSEGNGITQQQTELVFLNQEKYDGYRDMFYTEKIIETDSDDDTGPITTRYDTIRNNLTLIGSDDGESLSPCYDDYERSSWSDPDDNFRPFVPSYSNNSKRGNSEFGVVKNGHQVTFSDDTFHLSQSDKTPQISDFQCNQNAPKTYGDAPISNATENTPIGFTFVEVKDSFTEFSLRNYVRDKDTFDPKSDSGIITDSEELHNSENTNNEQIKSEDVEFEHLKGSDFISRKDPDDIEALEDTSYMTECMTQPKSPTIIDPRRLSENQCVSTTCASDSHREQITLTEVSIDPTFTMTNSQHLPLSVGGFSSTSIDNGKTVCLDQKEKDKQSDVKTTQSHDLPSVFDCLYVDTDSAINEAFAFHDDPALLICDDSQGAENNKQTVSISREQKNLMQTEITCWSSHTENFPSYVVGPDKNVSQSDMLVPETVSLPNKTLDVANSHIEPIRSSSPITVPSYYSDRQRKIHHEALFLEQSELDSENIKFQENVIDNDPDDRKQNQSGNAKSQTPQEVKPANKPSPSPRSIQIDTVFGLPGEQKDIMSANKAYNCSSNSFVNDTDELSICETTPNTALADNVKSQQPHVSDIDRNEKDRTARNSAVLEESPVILLDIKQKGDSDSVFEKQPLDSENTQEVSSVSLEEGQSVTLPDKTADLIKPDLSIKQSESLTPCKSNFDRSQRVTLPRQYTPSTDYRKLLKPTTPRRYTSVLQRPISTEKLHYNYRLPEKPVPKIRKRILASRQRFLSEDNLLSPNDSLEDPFSEYSTSERYHSPKVSSPSSPSDRQSYSVADISRLYASTLSEPRKHRPCIDQLHENCILSPERLALIRKRAFSTDSLPHRVSHNPSVSSLVETDIDSGQISEVSQTTNTDLDDFNFQDPVEKSVSMMDLRSGRSRFVARKKAAEERKKSKSLQQLQTNIGSLETDIDAPFPDGTGVTRVPSEHELRVSKSLSKLNVPDWLRRSTVFRSGSHFILRRDSNASTISQWSSKSYGPLATTRDSSRASSCATLSQPSPVVIKTRVLPSSTSRLLSSPKIGSPIRSNTETKQVTLPSAKFREKEKPNGLMPIPIVPFEKLRQKFEKKAATANPTPSPQMVEEVETKIIVEPDKNPPPGILKQSSPTQLTQPLIEEEEPIVNSEAHLTQNPPTQATVRLPPPKITITSEKTVSAKDKASPGAMEKSVRFSPVLNRMELSNSPIIMPPSPEADYKPANGGTSSKKPALPPKPAKKLLKTKSSDNPEPVQKTVKSNSKPIPAEKPPSRIANLIRRFKETTV